MAGRRRERSRKSINYSKFPEDGSQSADDEDFMDDTPPTKRSKKTEKKTKDGKSEKACKKEEVKGQERKARNRLSDEEKYEQQLEMALKMSLDARGGVAATRNSSDDSQPEEVPSTKSCTVEAEVLNSPNSKQNSTETSPVETRRQPVTNGASVKSEDVIVSEPKEDTSRRKSGRVKKTKEKEEDDYEISDEDESESDEDLSVDEESDTSDYEESPKTKAKMKKITQKKDTKVKINNKGPGKSSVLKSSIKKMPTVAPAPVRKANFKENKSPVPKPTAFKPLHQIDPSTPKSSRSLIAKRCSSIDINRPGKFAQPGWTPPGPAGSKSCALKSPQSPNVIRVGLSRNIKLTPLHPRVNIK